mgnify:CR=1 FL=1
MTDNVEYGPEIAVDGMPDWLGEDEKVIGRWGEDTWYSGGPTWKKCYASSGVITAIRLPADHWAYKAIDAGFIPWGGGDAAARVDGQRRPAPNGLRDGDDRFPAPRRRRRRWLLRRRPAAWRCCGQTVDDARELPAAMVEE